MASPTYDQQRFLSIAERHRRPQTIQRRELGMLQVAELSRVFIVPAHIDDAVV